MDAKLSRLMGHTLSSPLFEAIRRGLCEYATEEWLTQMKQRWIKARVIEALPRQDKMLAEQARQSYLVLENMGFESLRPPDKILQDLARKMVEGGLVGVQGNLYDVPDGIGEKYPEYDFFDSFDDWQRIGETGGRLIVQVGEDFEGEPVVIVSDAEDIDFVTFARNTSVYTMDELMKFSQDPITT
ncbi:MAG: hypothetical protein ACRC8Y_07655 [Chroococcales cyanobacterium]